MDDLIFLDGEREQPITYKMGGWNHHPEHKAPIEIILRLYLVSPTLLYLDNMDGFLTLRDWLGMGIVEEGLDKIPQMLKSYEVMRMSQALKVSEEQIFWTIMRIMYA